LRLRGHAARDLTELLAMEEWDESMHVVGTMRIGGLTREGPGAAGRGKRDSRSNVRSRFGAVGSDLYLPRPLWDRLDAVQAAHPRTRLHRVEHLADIL
jgi:hypothetical protein